MCSVFGQEKVVFLLTKSLSLVVTQVYYQHMCNCHIFEKIIFSKNHETGYIPPDLFSDKNLVPKSEFNLVLFFNIKLIQYTRLVLITVNSTVRIHYYYCTGQVLMLTAIFDERPVEVTNLVATLSLLQVLFWYLLTSVLKSFVLSLYPLF